MSLSACSSGGLIISVEVWRIDGRMLSKHYNQNMLQMMSLREKYIFRERKISLFVLFRLDNWEPLRVKVVFFGLLLELDILGEERSVYSVCVLFVCHK